MMDVDGLIALTKDLGIDDTDPALVRLPKTQNQ